MTDLARQEDSARQGHALVCTFFLTYLDNIRSIISEEHTQTPVLGNQTTPVILLADNLATGPFKVMAYP